MQSGRTHAKLYHFQVQRFHEWPILCIGLRSRTENEKVFFIFVHLNCRRHSLCVTFNRNDAAHMHSTLVATHSIQNNDFRLSVERLHSLASQHTRKYQIFIDVKKACRNTRRCQPGTEIDKTIFFSLWVENRITLARFEAFTQQKKHSQKVHEVRLDMAKSASCFTYSRTQCVPTLCMPTTPSVLINNIWIFRVRHTGQAHSPSSIFEIEKFIIIFSFSVVVAVDCCRFWLVGFGHTEYVCARSRTSSSLVIVKFVKHKLTRPQTISLSFYIILFSHSMFLHSRSRWPTINFDRAATILRHNNVKQMAIASAFRIRVNEKNDAMSRWPFSHTHDKHALPMHDAQ